jgi:hypothetical protein
MIRHPELLHIALYTFSLFCDKKSKPSEVRTFAHLFESERLQVGKGSDALGLSQSQEHGRKWQSRERQIRDTDTWVGSMSVLLSLPELQLSMLRPFAPNLDTLLASGPHKPSLLFSQTPNPLPCSPQFPSRLTTLSFCSNETLCRFFCPRLHLETMPCL